ncbi:hypothetical protein GGF32_005583 [Allomyces javanicus]|nr:hypothetical protein GGF32_005583 [Allomyces javanicus]
MSESTSAATTSMETSSTTDNTSIEPTVTSETTSSGSTSAAATLADITTSTDVTSMTTPTTASSADSTATEATALDSTSAATTSTGYLQQHHGGIDRGYHGASRIDSYHRVDCEHGRDYAGHAHCRVDGADECERINGVYDGQYCADDCNRIHREHGAHDGKCCCTNDAERIDGEQADCDQLECVHLAANAECDSDQYERIHQLAVDREQQRRGCQYDLDEYQEERWGTAIVKKPAGGDKATTTTVATVAKVSATSGGLLMQFDATPTAESAANPVASAGSNEVLAAMGAGLATAAAVGAVAALVARRRRQAHQAANYATPDEQIVAATVPVAATVAARDRQVSIVGEQSEMLVSPV